MGNVLKSVHAGEQKLASRTLCGASARTLQVTSPAFRDGAPLPIWTTADGDGRAPRIEWSELPPGTRSVVLLCEDPDAPFPKPFAHWIAYGIAPTERGIERSAARACKEGKNSKLATGYTGAAPPPGHGVHHYHFEVFALDRTIDLEEGSGRSALETAMADHVIAWGEIVGTYERT